ncbi:MAG: DegV family EDD domain-containing protein [Candidatus Heimdallarchaeota archaeon]|nr:DegV family EDD domain-containing protein [Candidatus Heimdallarchaeota archaeon]
MVQIVTESHADIPLSVAHQYNISVIPVRILHRNQCYHEQVDINADGFHGLLQDEFVPVTTPASPYYIYNLFDKIAKTGEDILIISSNEGTTGFLINVKIAIKYLKNLKLEIYHSGASSMFQGLLSIQAAVLAQYGFTATEIISILSQVVENMVSYTISYKNNFVPSKSAKFTLLKRVRSIGHKIKVGKILDGESEIISTARNINQATEFIVDELSKLYTKDEPVLVSVLHARNPIESSNLGTLVSQKLNTVRTFPSKLGSLLSSQLGLNALTVVVSPVLSEYQNFFV